MRRLILLVLVLAAVACEGPTAPVPPRVTFYGHRPMVDIVPQYWMWYADVEACLEQTGDFAAIEWMLADSIIGREDGKRYWGYTVFPNQITMKIGWETTPRPVRHEMVHHVTQVGDELHDAEGSVPCEGYP